MELDCGGRCPVLGCREQGYLLSAVSCLQMGRPKADMSGLIEENPEDLCVLKSFGIGHHFVAKLSAEKAAPDVAHGSGLMPEKGPALLGFDVAAEK